MGMPRGLWLRGRPVRVRFTILYAVVFLASGVGLLSLTGLLATSRTTMVPDRDPLAGQPNLAQERIRLLEEQLADTERIQAQQLLTGSLIALVVMAVVSVLLGRAVAGRVLRPLRTITAATRKITAENLHQRLQVPGPADEVKELADTVDGLLERLETSFAAQRRFVANASHELRTPLATMRASLDVAMAKPEPAPPQTVALADRLRTELDRVDRLLEGLLVLARAQHGILTDRASVPPTDRGSVPLGGLVSEVLAARAADLAARRLTVDDADLRDDVWVEGSPALLARVVENAVDNAIIHNRDGGRVRVATEADPLTARLVVESDGPVLDPEQVARLARPFQRLGADRTGSESGSGLGLSIVAAIADAHGGRLDLRARPEGGLRVTVSLPRAGGRRSAGAGGPP